MYRSRRPVELAERVEHGAANANPRVGFKAGTATRSEMLRGLQQTDHARLHQIVDLHLRWQSPGEVIGDALDEVGVAAHQTVEVRRWRNTRIGL